MSLYIPKRIRVGFQNRQGTFTGKLAYIIYLDDKGVLRKEKSWEGWRDSNIEALEFENTPRNGFLFNKGIQRHGYHWGNGRSVIRVYDPRDFEFEINVDNLIGILMHSDVSKRDIVEECVFAWEGTDLVLLPVNSDIYEESIGYTKKQAQKISAKELVKGYTYNQKKNNTVMTYIGYYEWYDWKYDSGYYNKTHKSSGKKHIFFDGKHYVIPGIATFSAVNTEEMAENYPALVEDYFKTIHSQPIKGLEFIPKPVEKVDGHYAFYKIEGDVVKTINFYYRSGNPEYISCSNNVNDTRVIIADKSTIINRMSYHSPATWGGPGFVRNYIHPLLDELNRLGRIRGLDKPKFEEYVSPIESNGFKRGAVAFVLENGAVCPTTEI